MSLSLSLSRFAPKGTEVDNNLLKLFDHILDVQHDAIFLKDAEAKWIYVNPAGIVSWN